MTSATIGDTKSQARFVDATVDLAETLTNRRRPAATAASGIDPGNRHSTGSGAEAATMSDAAWIQSQRVTVLMATYNRGHFIEEALDSLLSQTRPPDEIVVIDDGSTDDTRARLARYGDRIRYLAKRNEGKPAAINAGFAQSSGDWIWIFDDDDVALPGGLAALLQGLARQRDADWVYGGQVTGHSGNDGRIVAGHPVLPPELPAETLFTRCLRSIPFLLQAALVRREQFETLHGFDERYPRSQDYEFLLRLLEKGQGVRVPVPIFVWRSHDGPRGPRSLYHDGTQRERVWMEVAGQLGQDLRRRLPLAAYLSRPGERRQLGMHTLRGALLERMAVMASKGLTREMLVDLHSAANLTSVDVPPRLTADEAAACWEVGNFPFFQMRLLDAPERVVERLLSAADGPTGKALLARIARGILHAARLRGRPLAERRVLLRCAVRLFIACNPRWILAAYLPLRTA